MTEVKIIQELPHPEGWTFLGATREDREMGEINGSLVTAHFKFNNYYRSDPDGRLHLMSVQVFE